jgi:hypothetical protein
MNATDSEDRIIQGFAELLEQMRANVPVDPIPTNRRPEVPAIERERNRVWREYAEVGLIPPSEHALSITALDDLGLPLPSKEPAE